MIKRFLKSSVIFFVILGVSFSNVPFYALTNLIDSYEKTSGIVDKMWLVQQNHDSDVVDKFSSLRNISEKLKVQEAMAAASFIGNSNIVYTNGGVPTAITPNASSANGDLLVFYHYSRATGGNETVTLPAGFTTVFNSVTANYGLVAVGWRIKQAGDTTFTATITNHTSGTSGETVVEFIQTYRGTDTTSPIVNYTAALSTWASGLNVGPIAAPTTATVTDGDMAVVFGGKFENVTGQTVLSGDSLTWTVRTTLNTTLGLDAGGVVQTGLNASGSDKTVTAKTVTTTGTAQVGAGRMFIIKKAPDTTPPTPSPMTFATPPANDSTTQISMIATTATDADTPPVEYFFTLDNTNCAANAGTGGTSSAWQAGTSYSDSGLTANKCYGYTVKARDSVGTPNETTASGISSAYTSANTPGTPALGSPTTSTLNLTNAENSNPTANPTTNYAVQVVTTTPSDATWLNQWVDGSGNPSATAVWLTDAQLDALVLQGLQASTIYGVKVKAKNQDNDETPLSAEGQGTTSAPAMTLTISQTAGSKVATKNSGDVNQYAHDTACTGAGTCSAFTLASAGGTTNVTSIKITESGTVTANTELSDINLYYDYDGNWADAGAETLFGTVANFAGDQTATVSGTLAITAGATAYIYARYDLANGAVYPTGGATVNFQIAVSGDVVSDATESGTGSLAGAQTVLPNVTSITYPDSGQSGGRIGESMTVNGAGFGTTCDANNKVAIGAYTLSCTGATFNNTTISIAVDSGIPLTNDGGTGGSGLLVTIGSTADDANQTYFVLPSITGVTNCSSLPAGSKAREYAAGDSACGNGLKDGEVVITGTHFGSAGSVTILTQTATQAIVAGFCGGVAYKADGTCISVQVPATITDSTYTGNVVVTRTAGTKTDTLAGFRVLPRITANTPNSGIIADRIKITGDHLCQGAGCPVSPNRSGANDNVKFGSTQALDGDFVNSGAAPCSGNAQAWTDTEICVNVPAGTPVGSQPTIVRSSTYDSSTVAFTVNANTTTLATGSDPAVNTIAPGASATDVDLFTLQTNGGTESVTSVTVNLSTNSGIGLLAITDNANTVLGSTASPVTGSNVISVSGMSAGTGVTTFKVRVTPLSHAGMPAPAGASYAITAPVTAWAGFNTHAGSDTNTNALTIDNTSPAGTTGATPTAGDTQVQLSWTNPGDSDFQQVYIYCKTSSITEVPTEGTDPAVDATACDATARMKYKGTASPQTITGLSNGTLYYFRIYARDSNGNFTAIASTQEVSATPTLTQTLTVGTVGTQATNLNSGSTAQHIGGAGTAAFTLQINTGSSNATSVKVSDTGTVSMANLANPKLYYENAVDAASCAYGGAESFVSGAAPVGETVTFTLPSVAVGLTANVTCLYFVSDVTSSAVGGQTIELEITNPSTDVAVSSGVNSDTVAKAISGTTTIRPNVTSVTYPDSGQSGGRVGESMTVNGAGFGTTCDANNKVAIGAYTLSCTGATFSNTTITIAVDSGIPLTNDGGTGASGLLVTIGSTADDANQTYFVLPSITGVTNCASLPAGSKAREYASGDAACGNGLKDGEVVITGTHFGSAGSVTILTQTANQAIVAGFCGGEAYKADGTCISVQVPATITDSTYTGSVVVTRTAGTKTDTLTGFRVLPRITGLVNSSDSIGQPITVNGNHFCQSGSCPGVFSSANKVTFFSNVDAIVFTSWSHMAIVTEVPTGTVTGDVVIISDTSYTSNGSTFTLVSTTPNDPTNLIQKNANLITITTGETASSTPIRYTFDTSSGISGGTMYAQVEVRPVLGANKDFTSTCSANPYCFEGLGTAYSGGTINLLATSTPVDDIYHWQARVCYNKNGTHTMACDGTGDNPSALWVSFGANAETATDFKIDTTAPGVSVVSSSGPPTPGTNTATITWTTDELATSQVQYQAVAQASCTTYSFASSCATNNDCTTINTTPVYSPHTTALSNLNSGTDYCYRVRSKDAVGNERIDTNNYSFQTLGNLSPAKTTQFFVFASTTPLTTATTRYFAIPVSELVPIVKSAYIEINGLVTNGTGVRVEVNNAAFKNYEVSGFSNPTQFRILYKIISDQTSELSDDLTLNFNDVAPCTNGTGGVLCNKIIITPQGGATVDVTSARFIMTYSYTP